jgi:hypothetical protein
VDPSTARRRLATMVAGLALLTAGATHKVTLVTGDVVTLRQLRAASPA